MKKVLVLMLVVGLSSVAVAARNTDKTIQLTVKGWPLAGGVIYDEIPSSFDLYTLGIRLADGYAMDAMELGLEIIGTGRISLAVDEPRDIIVGGFESWSLIVDGVTDKGIGVMAGVTFGSVDGQLVDHILWGGGILPGTVVQLTSVGTNHIVAPEDRLLTADDLGSILVVPEPATIALLGLGSLALLRKRR